MRQGAGDWSRGSGAPGPAAGPNQNVKKRAAQSRTCHAVGAIAPIPQQVEPWRWRFFKFWGCAAQMTGLSGLSSKTGPGSAHV